MTSVLVTNNTIVGPAGGSSGIALNGGNDVRIVSNGIGGWPGRGAGGVQVRTVAGTVTGLVVQQNNISSGGGNGVTLNGGTLGIGGDVSYNQIYNNGGPGIRATGAVNDSLDLDFNNIIYNNGGLAIDTGPGGLNAPPDGPPMITSADEGTDVVGISYDGPAGPMNARLDLYGGPSCFGAQSGLEMAPGDAYITLDQNGDFSGQVSLPSTLTAGLTLTASVSPEFGITTERSPCVVVGDGGNSTPVAEAVSTTVQGDPWAALAVTQVTLAGTDADGDNLTFAIDTPPEFGSLSGITDTQCSPAGTCTASVTYTRSAVYGFGGPDSFTYTVSDGAATSAPATVDVTVQWEPFADPTPTDPTTTVDQPVTFDLFGGDWDEDQLDFAVTTAPDFGQVQIGQVTCDPGGLCRASTTYTPTNGFVGDDDFQFTVNDGTTTSAAQLVTIHVQPLTNQAPVAAGQTLGVVAAQPFVVTLHGTDVNDDDLSFAASTPSHGSLGTPGTPDCTALNECTADVLYTPDNGYVGPDSFTFTVSDGSLTSSPATISMDVENADLVMQSVSTSSPAISTGSNFEVVAVLKNQGPSDAPNTVVRFFANGGSVLPAGTTFVSGSVTTDSGTVACSESGGIVSCPAGFLPSQATATTSIILQTSTNTPPSINIAARGGSNAYDTDAGNNTLATGPISVSNQPPTADPTSATVNQGGSVDITLSGSDVDGNALVFLTPQAPAHGTLTGLVGGTADCSQVTTCTIVVNYTPDPGYSGPDSFTVTTNDGYATSDAATVDIDVVPVANQPPTANSGGVTVAQNNSVDFDLSGTDPDGDALTFAPLQPQHGVLSSQSAISCSETTPSTCTQTWRYTPDEGYSGPDSFTFTTNDGQVDSSPATIDITVQGATSADVRVSSFTDTPDPVTAGGRVLYSATVVNAGPGTATDVVFQLNGDSSSSLPFGTTFVSGSATGSGGPVACTLTGGVVLCPLGDLANNGSADIAVVLDTDGTIDSPTTTLVEGSVTTTSNDPNPNNDSATQFTTIDPATPGTVTEYVPPSNQTQTVATAPVVTVGGEVVPVATPGDTTAAALAVPPGGPGGTVLVDEQLCAPPFCVTGRTGTGGVPTPTSPPINSTVIQYVPPSASYYDYRHPLRYSITYDKSTVVGVSPKTVKVYYTKDSSPSTLKRAYWCPRTLKASTVFPCIRSVKYLWSRNAAVKGDLRLLVLGTYNDPKLGGFKG